MVVVSGYPGGEGLPRWPRGERRAWGAGNTTHQIHFVIRLIDNARYKSFTELCIRVDALNVVHVGLCVTLAIQWSCFPCYVDLSLVNMPFEFFILWRTFSLELRIAYYLTCVLEVEAENHFPFSSLNCLVSSILKGFRLSWTEAYRINCNRRFRNILDVDYHETVTVSQEAVILIVIMLLHFLFFLCFSDLMKLAIRLRVFQGPPGPAGPVQTLRDLDEGVLQEYMQQLQVLLHSKSCMI